MNKGMKLIGLVEEKTELKTVKIPWSSSRWCRHNYNLRTVGYKYPPSVEIHITEEIFCSKCGSRWEAIKEEAK